MPDTRQTTGHRWLLLALCAAAFWLRAEGLYWPKLHPDEHPLGRWIALTSDRLYLHERVYANGFFQLVRPFYWTCRAWDGLRQRAEYRLGLHDQPAPETDAILVARWFNVWVGTLTCAVLYAFVARVTRSRWAGLYAAALLAFVPYHVEHCHYGETDIAMALTLTAACWVWIVALDTGRTTWFLAAAGASGFAAGTKFPLLCLLVVTLAGGLMRGLFRAGWGHPGSSWSGHDPAAAGQALTLIRGALRSAVGGLLAFGAGFIVANPGVVLDWAWFADGMAYERQRVYGETALNLGPFRHDAGIKSALHFRQLVEGLHALGWGWLFLAMAGLPMAWRREYRRYWPVLLGFPALYLYYWLMAAPWVRTQEFMALLPILACWAAIAVVALWRGARPALRPALALLAVVALTPTLWQGLRVAALFGWKDTRVLAREWLERRVPAERLLAAEQYADAALPESATDPIQIGKIERTGLPYVVAQGADYLLRTASIQGRGLRHPLTDALYPIPQQYFDEFRARSARLAAWGPLPPVGLATFVSPTLEWYGLRPPSSAPAVRLALPQPLWVGNAYRREVGRQTYFAVGHELGAAEGVLLDRTPRTVALGGPALPDDPVYLILNTLQRPASVTARYGGRSHRRALAPYDVAVIPLTAAWWYRSYRPFETLALRAEPAADGVEWIPCYARLAFGRAEALRRCLDLGRPDRAGELLAEATGEDDGGDAVSRYIAAVRSGQWDLADRGESAAERVVGMSAAAARVDRGLSDAATDPPGPRINGINSFYYDEMARLRLSKPAHLHSVYREADVSRDRMEVTSIRDVLTVQEAVHTNGAEPRFQATLTLPARLARGHYLLHAELKVLPVTFRAPAPPVLDYTVNDRRRQAGRYRPAAFDAWDPIVIPFTAETELQPAIIIQAPAPVRLVFRNLELTWSLASALDAVRADFRIARAEHRLHRRRYAEALALLAEPADPPDSGDSLAVCQLRFHAWRGLGRDPAATRAAAEDVLAWAPQDYECLLATDAPAAAALADRLRAPPVFAPFLQLVDFAYDPERREARCVFEALHNETPPLAATFWIKRRGEWRNRQSASLTSRPSLERGERVAVTVRLNEALRESRADRLAVGVQADAPWHPGALPLAADGDVCVPFDALLDGRMMP